MSKTASRKHTKDANALKGQTTAADASQPAAQSTPHHDADTSAKGSTGKTVSTGKKLKRKASTGDAVAEPADTAAAVEAANAPQIAPSSALDAQAVDGPTQSAALDDGKEPNDDEQARPKKARRR